MTSLDERYNAKDILELYRARWQIELLFKRIKQFFLNSKDKGSNYTTFKSSNFIVAYSLVAD